MLEPITSKQRRHQQTRTTILECAWALAASDGVANLSLRDLARDVGMRAPSLYTYFPSKDAIYDAMFAEGYKQLNASLDDIEDLPAGTSRKDVLRVALEAFIEFCQASPARYQLMFTKAIPGWAPSETSYAISVESYEHMAELLADNGIVGAAPLDLWTAVASGLAAQQMANDPRGDRWRKLAPAAVEMLVGYVDTMETRKQ